MRRSLILCIAVFFVASSVSVPLTGAATYPILIGRTGWHNSFVISLKFPNGRRVRTIPAGTYMFVIHDYSRHHNFALGSQTENKRLFTTGIRWVGTRRYTLTLTPGNYAYACSAHFQTMNGTFVVTAAQGAAKRR